MKTYRPITAAFAALFVVGLLGGTSPSYAAAATATSFSGRATAVKGFVTVPVLGTVQIGPLADTGDVSPSGDSLHETLVQYPIPGVNDPLNGALSAEVLHAAVVAHGNKSSAEASVASFTLTTAPGQSVSADFLMARASATCQGNTATVAGSSEVVGLQTTGLGIGPITVTGQANQTIQLPLGAGQIVINEQPVASASEGNGNITVNALHVVINGVADVTVASAHADIACGGLTGDCANQDFVTGGGWITQTPSGAKANFAVAGGMKNGAFWGHLTYIDHGNPGMKVKGTGVTAYIVVTGTTSRHIKGTTEGGGTYEADVSDGGEPGRGVDTFVLTLSNGYSAGGPIAAGNIQLHCK